MCNKNIGVLVSSQSVSVRWKIILTQFERRYRYFLKKRTAVSLRIVFFSPLNSPEVGSQRSKNVHFQYRYITIDTYLLYSRYIHV